MKVILDANIWLSFLAAPSDGHTIVQIVHRCFTDSDMQLVVPSELIAEVIQSATGKPYFQQRVPREHVADLIESLSVLSEIPDEFQSEIENFTRDRQDDYLVAYGLLCGVDYLVTGDKDLLVLQQVQGLRIVKPVDLLKLLRST